MVANLTFAPGPGLALVFGYHEEHLRLVETLTGATVSARGNEVTVKGPKAAVARAVAVLEALPGEAQPVTAATVRRLARGGGGGDGGRGGADAVAELRLPRLTLEPRGERQRSYVRAIRESSVVFGVGPAGTGKTYLAVACALESFLAQRAERIILVRPVVEAGERLGFLPGGVEEKINPYMRPLYDALQDMLDPATVRRLIAQETVEIAPLAYMRGRTLHRAFIILDEAQNTTVEQMKMFLTRLGPGSQAVLTGDITQIDLPRETPSGLVDAAGLLEAVAGVRIVRFTPDDVVRHEMVARILEAYDRRGRGSRAGGA